MITESPAAPLQLVIDFAGRHWSTLCTSGAQVQRLRPDGQFGPLSGHSEWTSLSWPLCFQCRKFDVYCSWLLFKGTSHLSKMPQERWRSRLSHIYTHSSHTNAHIFQAFTFCRDWAEPWLAVIEWLKLLIRVTDREGDRVWPTEELGAVMLCPTLAMMWN